MKIYHIALLSPGQPNTAIGREFKKVSDYREIDWARVRDLYGLPHLRSQIIFEVQEFKPDIIFMQLQTPGVIDKATAETLKQNSFVVNWTGDVRSDINWYVDLADHVHVTMFTNMTDVNKMRKHGKVSDYLQIGFDDEIYSPEGTLNTLSLQPTVVFMGNNYIKSHLKFPGSKERVEMVQFMKNNFKNFKVYGSGWANTTHLEPEHEARSYRSAVIGINQNHFDYEMFSSDRILRIMGCGCLCASKYYNGIEKEYREGKDLVIWTNLKELKAICEYYTHNIDLRNEIAASGMKLVREHYTWRGRVQELINKFEKFKNQKA